MSTDADRAETPDQPGRTDDPRDDPHAQPAADPRGRDEVRREMGAGDGDDPPPAQDDDALGRQARMGQP